MSDVLVVGAGPVGLTAAAELARHGVRLRIIDRLPQPTGYCKAIGVTPRTLETWDDMGIARTMIDAGVWIEGVRMIVPGRPPRDAIPDFSDLPYGNLGLPQYATERILTEHLARLGVAVERGVALAGLKDDGRRVAVELQHDGGRREQAEFRYVVGCDGAHSAVRHALGIGFPGDRFPMTFMLGDVAIHWDVPRGLAMFAVEPHEDAPPDMFIAVPLPDRHRYRVSTIAPEAPTEAAAENDHGIMADRAGPGLDTLQAVADRLLPDRPRLSDLRWSSLFSISMRLADRYRVGNVFIAGDAAHIHPPTGGQGMNTGIQDAYNLAWKLALVLRGAADARLLDSYEAERRPVGVDTVARTVEASRSLDRSRGPQDRLADTQILVNYRDSAWVEEAAPGRPGPQAGDRAPDAQGLRRDHVGFPLRLFDVTRGTEHVLVVYIGGSQAMGLLADVEQVARALNVTCNDLLRTVAIAPADNALPEPVGFALLRDGEAAFARAYEATPGLTLLIRPDGYIAYRSDAFVAASVIRAIAKVLVNA